MAIEVAPTGRSILLTAAIILTILIWMQTSGALLTLAVIAVAVAVVTLLAWGGGTRLLRRIAGAR